LFPLFIALEKVFILRIKAGGCLNVVELAKRSEFTRSAKWEAFRGKSDKTGGFSLFRFFCPHKRNEIAAVYRFQTNTETEKAAKLDAAEKET
jgi:hypothetical protein